MRRELSAPRPHWQERMEEIGFSYHSIGGGYWREGAYYHFSEEEVITLRKATEELHRLCLEAVNYVVDRELYHYFMLPTEMYELVYRSWKESEPSLYGRFDLAFDGRSEPKLLEYNADTPTSLFEAGFVQEHWRRDAAMPGEQWNELSERLQERWRTILPAGSTVWCSCVTESPEDRATVRYLEERAREAGLRAKFLFIDEIGFTPETGRFVDLEGEEITHLFKLYPWEWMWGERFTPFIGGSGLHCIEPAWKMLLSNKAILPILWQLFPNHPNLLPASRYQHEMEGAAYVRKPILSREGANVTLFDERGISLATSGAYGKEGYVYQQRADIPSFNGWHPVIGAWVVGDKAAGIGIREDETSITKNTSWFVPHVVL